MFGIAITHQKGPHLLRKKRVGSHFRDMLHLLFLGTMILTVEDELPRLFASHSVNYKEIQPRRL